MSQNSNSVAQQTTATATLADATFTVLRSFSGTDGAGPDAQLIMDNTGNLYGTTVVGGAYYGGTAFKLDTNGNLSTLQNFSDFKNGWELWAGLFMDKSGNLYGTACYGGAHDTGTVFKLALNGNGTYTESVLHNFSWSGSDGENPRGGVIMDSAGNLYGTTYDGCRGVYGYDDNGGGSVFKLDTSGHLTVLHSFSGPDGWNIWAGLTMDTSGNLHGTASEGGQFGGGTIFKLDTSGNNFVVLHNFNGTDGEDPHTGLIMDGAGNLYGTTALDGANHAGEVFKLDTRGKLTVLHSFSGYYWYSPYDGAYPDDAGLILDSLGNLYGTTTLGGAYGQGIVFKLTLTISIGDITNIISQLSASGCITSSGVANSLTSQLSAAQTAISSGDNKTAVNILNAQINEINAQSGKHICSDGAATLIADDTTLINSL